MADIAEMNSCFDQVEEMLGRFLALFAVDCLLRPALERVAADIDALNDTPHTGRRSVMPGRAALQSSGHSDD